MLISVYTYTWIHVYTLVSYLSDDKFIIPHLRLVRLFSYICMSLLTFCSHTFVCLFDNTLCMSPLTSHQQMCQTHIQSVSHMITNVPNTHTTTHIQSVLTLDITSHVTHLLSSITSRLTHLLWHHISFDTFVVVHHISFDTFVVVLYISFDTFVVAVDFSFDTFVVHQCRWSENGARLRQIYRCCWWIIILNILKSQHHSHFT